MNVADREDFYARRRSARKLETFAFDHRLAHGRPRPTKARATKSAGLRGAATARYSAPMFLNFFAELRKARVPVTPREFLDLLRALDREVPDTSIEDFYRLGRALLVKDERHLDAFDV